VWLAVAGGTGSGGALCRSFRSRDRRSQIDLPMSDRVGACVETDAECAPAFLDVASLAAPDRVAAMI
jgi:hypothetical protein